MKLHLPTSLRGALLACMGLASTAYAADYNAAHVTSGTRPEASSGYDGNGIYAVVDGTNTKLNEVAAGNKIIFNLTSGYMVKADKTGDNAIVADIEIQNMKLNDGYSNQTYEFTGTVTGSGTLWFNKQSPTNQNYTFTGDVSGFDGVIDFNKQGEDKDHTFTFTNNDATAAKTLNASSVSVGGEIIFNGTGNYTSNSTLTAYEVQANTNVSFSKNVTALTSFSVAEDKTATFTAGILDLTGASVNNSGTLDFSTGSATLRLAEDGGMSGTYTVGTLTLGDRALTSVLTGLVGRQVASYADGVISITTGQLVWKAAADGETWTGATWDMNGTDTTFLAADNVTFGADAGSKKVGITEDVTAGTITIEDDYEFNVTSNATVTGTFSMADSTTLTKTGDAQLTIGTSSDDNSFSAIRVQEGTLVVQDATIGTLESMAGTTTKLQNNGISITTLDVSGEVILTQNANYAGISKVHVHDGGELKLDTVATGLACGDITIDGGGTIRATSYGDLGTAGGNIYINAEGESTAKILGALYGSYHEVHSDISGKGTVEFGYAESTHQNAFTVVGTIKDGTEGDYIGTLAVKQTNGHTILSGANTYTGGTELSGGSMTVSNSSALGNGDVTITTGTDESNNQTAGELVVSSSVTSLNLGADDHTLTIEKDATLKMSQAVELTGALTMEGGAKLNLTGFDLSAQTFSGETTVLTTTGDMTVGNITVQGIEGTAALKAVDNTLSVVTSPDLVLTDVVSYANDTLTFNLTTDVTHLIGDVVISLGDMTSPELGELVYAAKGDFEGEVSLSFRNADGELIYLGNVTSLTINGYSGEESWAVAADGLSVSPYRTVMLPEPTTTTLSLLALAGLAARRRRK